MFYNPDEPLDMTGCMLALVSGVTSAVYIILLSGFKYKEISGFKFSFYISVVCSVMMLAVCLVGGRLTLPTTLMGWLLCFVLALVINVGAVVLFQRGTFLIGGEHASILSTVEPLTGVVIGVTVFQDKITVLGGIGAVLVMIACIWLGIADAKASE